MHKLIWNLKKKSRIWFFLDFFFHLTHTTSIFWSFDIYSKCFTDIIFLYDIFQKPFFVFLNKLPMCLFCPWKSVRLAHEDQFAWWCMIALKLEYWSGTDRCTRFFCNNRKKWQNEVLYYHDVKVTWKIWSRASKCVASGSLLGLSTRENVDVDCHSLTHRH